MTIDKRQGAVFASGVLLGAAAVAGALKKREPDALQAPEDLKTTIPLPQSEPDERATSASPPQLVAEPSQEHPSRPQNSTRDTTSDLTTAPVAPRAPWPEPPETAVPPPRSDPPAARQRKVFIAGSMLAAVAIAGAWWLLDPLGLPISGQPVTKVSVSGPQASGQIASCPLTPATTAAGSQDGRFPFEPDAPGLVATDMASFVVMGKEAAASNRPRDAEVAFLMSCRVADKLKGPDSVESANGKYLLGTHYAQRALGAGSANDASRPELLKRAEFLYMDSLRIYSAAYGQADERSQSATGGLATVRQMLAQAPAAQPPDAAEKAHHNSALASLGLDSVLASSRLSVAKPSVPKVEVAKADLPASELPRDERPGMRAEASFDCSRARSAPEKMICSDAELFQLNHEVGRVYAHAKNVTTDRAAFRRQNAVEARRRETICRDRGCFQRWYAYRRDQLLNEIEGRTPSLPRAWR